MILITEGFHIHWWLLSWYLFAFRLFIWDVDWWWLRNSLLVLKLWFVREYWTVEAERFPTSLIYIFLPLKLMCRLRSSTIPNFFLSFLLWTFIQNYHLLILSLIFYLILLLLIFSKWVLKECMTIGRIISTTDHHFKSLFFTYFL